MASPAYHEFVQTYKERFKWFFLGGFVSGVSVTTFYMAGTEQNRKWVGSVFDRCYRFILAAQCVLAISFDYKFSLRNLSDDERHVTIKEVHQRSADRMLRVFRENRGIYIKAGQHLNSLDYVLPPEYTTTMAPLCDQAPYCPYEDVCTVFQEEFGASPDEMYASFEQLPIAAASLAQVHKATRHDGEEVAVKVQFPGLKQRCDNDVKTIEVLVNFVQWLFPEFEFKWLVDEFNLNLPNELDFIHEARNSERCGRNFANNASVSVPRIFWDQTTRRVLTMEFINGTKLDDIDALKDKGFSVSQVATLLSKTFNEQIFIHGFVHCDPHPGNLLVRPKRGAKKDWWGVVPAELVLLDHGLYRELKPNFKLDYARLWKAVIEGDEEAIKEMTAPLGVSIEDFQMLTAMLTARSFTSLHRLDSEMTEAEKKILQQNAQDRIVEISHILANVPSDLLLMFKTNDLLRSLNHSLGSPINTLTITVSYCLRALAVQSLKDDRSLTNRLRIKVYAAAWRVKLYALEWALWLYSIE